MASKPHAHKDKTEHHEGDTKEVSPIAVQKYLAGVDYPANRQDLINAAEAHGAEKSIMDFLKGLPDREFEKPTDVMKNFGHKTGSGHDEKGHSKAG